MKFASKTPSTIGICVISFFLLELAPTILDPWMSHGVYVYDAELGFRIRPGALGSNRLGFNDVERSPQKSDPSTIRVVILGDSFNWKDGAKNYTHLLDQEFARSHHRPPVEILNAGFPMTHTGEELALLKQTLPLLNPDLVVLAFFAGNDFIDAQPYRKRIVANDALIDIDTFLRRRRVAFAIVILPDEIQVDDRLLARILDRYGLSRFDYVMDLPQTLVQRIASENGIPCLDLLWGFREAAYRDPAPLYQPRNTHWNEKGEPTRREPSPAVAGGTDRAAARPLWRRRFERRGIANFGHPDVGPGYLLRGVMSRSGGGKSGTFQRM